MAHAEDTFGSVFKEGSAILLARVVDGDGTPITSSGIAAIHYTVSEADLGEPNALTPVSGHQDAALAPQAVIYDSLQDSLLWTEDTTGFNFKHEVDVGAAEAFPIAGAAYQVRYEVTPLVGQKLIFRFVLRAI